MTPTSEPSVCADGRWTWWRCEPRRLARDQAEVGARFPDLVWAGHGAGSWTGVLPAWPFDRPEPDGFADRLGPQGLDVVVEYSQAYPMVPPAIYPVRPVPELVERTQHRWHVMGDGSLCLLQAAAAWTGRDSIVDLLLKAAAWRIEYALMKAGLVTSMTTNGIVDDESVDDLVQQLPLPVHELGDEGGPAESATC